MQDRDNNRQFLATCFGRSSVDGAVFSENGDIHVHAHPWARQLGRDMLALKEIESGESMWTLGGSLQSILFEDFEDFVKIDVDELRAKSLTDRHLIRDEPGGGAGGGLYVCKGWNSL